MNGWDRAKELTQKNAGGLFLRFKNNGDKAVVAFCGEPWAYETHWKGGEYVDCTGPGCVLCTKGLKPSTRVKINAYLVADKTMKIWECSGKTCREIADIREKYALEKWGFEVKRNGAANDTKTTYRIFPERELSPDERRAIESMPLHDLKTARDTNDDDDDVDSSGAANPDAPISPRAVAEFRERIRLLPLGKEEKKLAYYAILGAFGCERLDDLVVAQEHRARSLIERAERGEAIAPTPSATDRADEFV